MTDLVTVSGQVPEDRVAEFFEMVAALNRPKMEVPVPALPQRWANGDEHLAKQVFAWCSPNAQKVLSYLAHRPGQDILGETIAKGLGMDKGHMAIAGIVGPIGTHCKKVRRDMPYEKHYTRGATAAFYTMSKEVANLFKAAADGGEG